MIWSRPQVSTRDSPRVRSVKRVCARKGAALEQLRLILFISCKILDGVTIPSQSEYQNMVKRSEAKVKELMINYENKCNELKVLT